METKTYRAKSMQEAIACVRAELGDAACILHSRRIRSRMDQLLGRRGVLEVVAAKDADVPSRFPGDPSTELENVEPSPANSLPSALEREPHDFVSHLMNSPAGVSPVSSPGEKHGMPLHEHMYRAGFTPDDCLMLNVDPQKRDARGDSQSVAGQSAWTDCCERLCQSFKTIGPLTINAQPVEDARDHSSSPFVVAFVGPTGVGKTTTLAKLAAHYYLQQQLRVGLITVDTYRIAAVEQLRTYARIIDAPLEVVGNAADMKQACRRLVDMDLILIDTGGNSPKDDQRLRDLQGVLPAADADEIILVMSSVCSASAFRRSVDAYGALGVSSLVLTKLDEADGFGQLWQPILESHLPLRYVTDGQDVPRDIAVATPPSLTWEILGGLPEQLAVHVPQEERHA